MNFDIKKRIDSFANPESTNLFFDLLHNLIIKLDIKPDDERLSVNVRNDYRKRISVNINGRLVFYIKDGDFFGFMIENIDKLELSKFVTILESEDFARSNASLIKISFSDVSKNRKFIETIWIKSCELYFPSQSRSQYRQHHISELYNIAMDKSLLNSYIENITNPLRTFVELINDFKEYIKAEDCLIKDFEIQKPKSYFVWISDPQKIISNQTAHYEIINRENKIFVEIHFENINFDQRIIFFKTIVNLPKDIEWFNWHKAKSIQYNKSFDLNDSDILKHLSTSLLYLDKQIGNEVRDILIKMNTSISNDNQIDSKNKNMNFPLNQILFGPPGTGKTYNTINKALEIIENKTEDTLKKESRIDLKNRFDNYVQNGQIVFTTFHQSMCYEDFIEGIKPKTIDDTVTYSIEDGVFKKLCNKAKGKNIKSNNFEDAYSKLIKMIDEAPEKKIVLETLVHSKEFTIYKNSKNNIRFHANTEKAYEGVIKKEVIEQFLKTGEAIDWPSYTKSLGSFIIENCNYSQQEVSENQNFVLIIDEINRGNVSQIFGELITLIEDDKRMGAKEALEVTLPYSKEKFGVPSNLYIIGTMNTADRSVEALDSALRRRFSFEETPPLPEILSPGYRYWDLLWDYKNYEWENEEFISKEKQMLDFFGASQNIWDTRKELWKEFKKENKNEKQALKFINADFTGVNLQDILLTINKRIEILLDKDHKIGHSYFMNVSSMNGLKTAFQNKIIPLLQEYFFGDYAKIGLVLGNGFIEKVELKKEKLFAEFDNDYESDYADKPIFHLININDMNDQNFKQAIDLLMNKKITS